eukprot:gene23898-biopygen7348
MPFFSRGPPAPFFWLLPVKISENPTPRWHLAGAAGRSRSRTESRILGTLPAVDMTESTRSELARSKTALLGEHMGAPPKKLVDDMTPPEQTNSTGLGHMRGLYVHARRGRDGPVQGGCTCPPPLRPQRRRGRLCGAGDRRRAPRRGGARGAARGLVPLP